MSMSKTRVHEWLNDAVFTPCNQIWLMFSSFFQYWTKGIHGRKPRRVVFCQVQITREKFRYRRSTFPRIFQANYIGLGPSTNRFGSNIWVNIYIYIYIYIELWISWKPLIWPIHFSHKIRSSPKCFHSRYTCRWRHMLWIILWLNLYLVYLKIATKTLITGRQKAVGYMIWKL